MPAYAFEVEEAEAEGIRFLWRCVPVELRGRGRVERIVLERAGERLSVPAATVVAAIGQLPRTELAAWTDELARAGIPMSAFFAQIERRMVDQELTATYDLAHGDRHPQASSRRRRSA